MRERQLPQAPAVRPRRVLLVASAGGHWIQLCRLSPAVEDEDALYVTTLDGARTPSGERPVAVVRDASRSDPLSFVQLIAQLVGIFARFRPEVVITTGAAPGLMALMLGRILGARTVWIDSVANCERLSLSGRLAKGWASLRLTQWPEVAENTPQLDYYGSVL